MYHGLGRREGSDELDITWQDMEKSVYQCRT